VEVLTLMFYFTVCLLLGQGGACCRLLTGLTSVSYWHFGFVDFGLEGAFRHFFVEVFLTHFFKFFDLAFS